MNGGTVVVARRRTDLGPMNDPDEMHAEAVTQHSLAMFGMKATHDIAACPLCNEEKSYASFRR